MHCSFCLRGLSPAKFYRGSGLRQAALTAAFCCCPSICFNMNAEIKNLNLNTSIFVAEIKLNQKS